MSLLAFSIGGLVILLVVRALYHHASLRRDWEFVSAAWTVDAFADYEVKARSEAAAIGSAFRRAHTAHSREESRRLLDLGLQLVERTADDWPTLLRAVGLLSRMADAVTPLSPLVPWAFQMPSVSGLALLNSIAHYMVVTTGERLRLRAYVLRGCWRLARAGVVKQASRIRAGQDAWSRLDAARADLATTRVETLVSFRLVLLSLSARPTSAAVAATARRS